MNTEDENDNAIVIGTVVIISFASIFIFTILAGFGLWSMAVGMFIYLLDMAHLTWACLLILGAIIVIISNSSKGT